MTEQIDDTNNTKLISLKKFFIFNPKYGSAEGDVNLNNMSFNFIRSFSLVLLFGFVFLFRLFTGKK